MSWQEYVDDKLIGSQIISKACIAGLDGSIWAKSEDFEVTKDELVKLIGGFGNQRVFITNGLTLAGQKYIFISGSEVIVRAKKGTAGVHCMKTKTAVVVGVYNSSVQPAQAASTVESLGDQLMKSDY